jgi:methylmalonyl-CoA mutase, N-terminal domain
VGVNAFKIKETIDLERLDVDPAIEEGQRQRLAKIRARRSNASVQELLSRLGSAAQGNENLMPIFVECVENDITLGEICGVLRQVWGEYQSPAWI